MTPPEELKGRGLPGPAEIPALDTATLSELRQEGERLLLDLIEIFLCETPARLDLLATAIANGDSRIAERAAHTVKNSAATLGAVSMQTAAAAAEDAARGGKLSEVAALLDNLRLQSEKAVAALIAERTRLNKSHGIR
jgi:HPt (histidine-containing phosphotransfer) domain-containing protein